MVEYKDKEFFCCGNRFVGNYCSSCGKKYPVLVEIYEHCCKHVRAADSRIDHLKREGIVDLELRAVRSRARWKRRADALAEVIGVTAKGDLEEDQRAETAQDSPVTPGQERRR